MPVLPITIYHKHAVYTGKIPYVCSNSDYEVVFTFDDEWEGHTEKTVRFCAGDQCVDRIMTGNTCTVPVLESGSILQIGVYAGNLQTSTAALVRMCDSIRSIGGTPAEPEPSVYDQIMERLNAAETGKYISSYRIVTLTDGGKNTYTLELIYNDGGKLSIELPQMGIDIDRVVAFGTEDPTDKTAGQTKQLYVNTQTGKVWICEDGAAQPTNWIPIAGEGSGTSGGTAAADNTADFDYGAAYADVSAAVEAGKHVRIKYYDTEAEETIYAPLSYILPTANGDVYVFGAAWDDGVTGLWCRPNGTWVVSQMLFGTSMGSTPSNARILTEKAVYNYVSGALDEYWETADKTAIVDAVLAALPTWTGGSY